MRSVEEIKKVFDDFFKFPNPMFCIPVVYFQHDNFLCEVAKTPDMEGVGVSLAHPLSLLNGLFVADGYWITVLEETDAGYTHREDLCQHVDSLEDIERFKVNIKDDKRRDLQRMSASPDPK